MVVEVKNIFADLPQRSDAESFLSLFQSGSTKIERIVSRSHSSRPDFWYDQPQDEWVIVLLGAAILEFEGGASVELKAGDYLTLPRHVRHWVARTSVETIWLAVHSQ
jgi:cupin 2 domain-containing protein